MGAFACGAGAASLSSLARASRGHAAVGGCDWRRHKAARRSYPLPQHFPFPPVHLVMERRRAGRCNLYRHRDFCANFSRGRTFEPEYHVREAIASFLDGCHWRSCVAVDLGANNGWMMALMLSLGAHVIAVDPQRDFVACMRETVDMNCWSDRGKVVHGFVDASPQAGGLREVKYQWRAGGWPRDLVLPDAPAVPLDQILYWKGGHVDFVKMDADGPEGQWLARIDHLLSSRAIYIHTMVVEGNGCGPALLYSLQQRHKYHVYLLDMHVDRRFLDARGVDVYSGFADTNLPPFLEELYSIRFMRHLYFFRSNMTLQEWARGVKVRHMYENQYLLTKEKLLEPRWENKDVRANPSWHRRKSGYVAPPRQ